jgi:biotin operon repressor
MPQILLPLIPDGASQISDVLSVVREDDQWTYFYGARPVFSHPQDDQRSFRMFTSQLVCQGACRQVDIIRTFGVSKESVLRNVKKFREQGIDAFYVPRRGRGPTVMTPVVARQAQQLLNSGVSRSEVAQQLSIKSDTLRKAIDQGRLQEPSLGEQAAATSPASDKSQRSEQDAAAADEMGTACTRSMERVCAALGLLPDGAPTRFEPCRDVSFGGVLCALPALIQNGLFRHLEQCFSPLGGYYTTLQVIILLAWMALCRIKTVEQLQYHSPGELGKLLGLDRVPEVRCLRNKLTRLSADDAPEKWAALLSKDWLDADSDLAGSLYVDGHVRLYHGKLTKLPRRYVSRQRLCLRGTTDYWVNDALGQPFFVVERPIDQGLLEAIESDIVPRLLQDVPRQPSDQELEADPYRCRFVMLFDREGYSPAFFKKMWRTHRIACITYHKHPKEAWPEAEFAETNVTLPGGETVTMKLAERGSWVGGQSEGLWMREVRKLNPSGHQTSLISTAYGRSLIQDAAGLFSRWCQENFFRYAMEHFGIDLLSEYGTEEMAATKRPVVNPARRQLDRQRRSLQGKLTRWRAQYAALTLRPEDDEKKVSRWEKRKAESLEEIQQLEHELETVQAQRQETPTHLEWKELPEEETFERLSPSRKRLLDTVKMTAYRAETALAGIVREPLSREDDARSVLRDLFRSAADLIPSPETNELKVRVHTLANPRTNRAIQHLLKELNAASLTYPGTNWKLVYSLLGAAASD